MDNFLADTSPDAFGKVVKRLMNSPKYVRPTAKPESFAADAYGFPFDYDPKTGQVTSHGAKEFQVVLEPDRLDELLDRR